MATHDDDYDGDSGGGSGPITPDRVQTLIAKALRPLQDQLAASERRANDAEAESSRLRMKAHRAALMGLFECAIAAGDINPAAREKFSRMHRLDDDEHVLNVTELDARSFIDGVKDVPQFRGTRKGPPRSKITLGKDIDTAGKTTAQLVSELTEAQIRADGAAVTDYPARERAFYSVLRRHPDLSRQYWADPNAEYQES